MRLGHARCDITPPLGMPMGGYAARDRGCDEVLDELVADAIYLEQGATKTMWITLDLISVHEGWGNQVRRGIASKVGIDADKIFLLPSHTHFGPATGVYDTLTDPVHKGWIDELVQTLIRLGEEAAKEPVSVVPALGRADVSPMVYNRRLRRPDGTCCMVLRLPLPEGEEGLTFGPIDPNLTLLRFDKEDGTPALIFYSVAIHPVIGGGNFYGISADYPGVVRRILEPAIGAPVTFALGTAGNLVPIQRGDGQRERIGRYLAGAALQAMSTAEPLASQLRVAQTKIDIPAEPRGSASDMEQRVEHARKHLEAVRERGGKRYELQQADEALRRAEMLIDWTRQLGAGDTIPFEVGAIGLGDFGIVTLPGEIFVETGLHLQARSPFPQTLVLSLANQATGYLPTRSAFWAGGYEVSVSRLCESSEEVACETANRLLLDVWEALR